MLPVLEVVVPLIAVLVGLHVSSRDKQARRAAHLAAYPSVDQLLAVLDKTKYREIRDRHRRTGTASAARAVQVDYPGITPAELAQVVKAL